MTPGQQDLGGLAGEEAERRDASDGVAGEERRERLAVGQRGAGREAQSPARGAEHESKAAQRENSGDAPADTVDTLEDVGDVRTPDDVDKERGADQRVGRSQQTPAATVDRLRPVGHTWRRVSTCFKVSSISPSWSSFDT